jgi:hypothetical protein
MARMKKRQLSWEASRSSQVVGYKFYWSFGSQVDYDANNVALGNITEITLPDDVAEFMPTNGPVEFGITAVDELGNESDMVTLKAPYQFSVPEAPVDLRLVNVEDTPTQTAGGPEADDPESQSMNLFKNEGGVRLLKSL